MFLQYSVPGAVLPLFSVWLDHLHFTPLELACAFATSALAQMLAPLLAGQIADRWVAAERCIVFCAILSGALLWVLAELTTPWAVFFTSLTLWFFFVPVLTLGVSLSLRQLEHPERDFGRVRLWGTVGWMASGWFLSLWFAEEGWLRWFGSRDDLADSLRLAGIMAWLLAAYALTLPHTPPAPGAAQGPYRGMRQAFEAPRLAFGLCRQRSFAVYCICSLGLYITIPFSSQMSPLLLKQGGLPREWLPSVLTIAQWTEVLTLALLPMIVLRLHLRGTMLVGLMAWALSLSVQCVGTPLGLVMGALGFNGICICCYLVAGQLYVNRQARADIRASAQGLLVFINGIGLLVGHLATGAVRLLTPGEFVVPFALGAALAFVLVLVFLVGFTGAESPMSEVSAGGAISPPSTDPAATTARP
jgi:MFS family permease